MRAVGKSRKGKKTTEGGCGICGYSLLRPQKEKAQAGKGISADVVGGKQSMPEPPNGLSGMDCLGCYPGLEIFKIIIVKGDDLLGLCFGKFLSCTLVFLCHR